MAGEKKAADAFEAALKRELQGASSSNAADCPAPEILAAYYDRSLSRSERARVDSHLTSCVRCQLMMASIARADDAAGVPIDAEPAPRLLWITRLLAPLAVAAVVIVIAIGVRTREQRAPEVIALASPVGPSKLELAERAAAPPPEAAVPAPQAPGAPQAGGAMKLPKSAQLARKDKAPKESEAVSAQDSISPRGEALSAPAQPQNAPAEMARALRAPSVATGSAFSGATETMAKQSRMNQVASPDGSVAWQFGSDGAIMRSGNSSPWLALRSGVTTDLLAASAPSNDVCWIVGKSGTIVRTLDGGAHWMVVKPPSRDDLTAISATDSNNATVIAPHGAHFVTHDGGVTWSSP